MVIAKSGVCGPRIYLGPMALITAPYSRQITKGLKLGNLPQADLKNLGVIKVFT